MKEAAENQVEVPQTFSLTFQGKTPVLLVMIDAVSKLFSKSMSASSTAQ